MKIFFLMAVVLTCFYCFSTGSVSLSAPIDAVVAVNEPSEVLPAVSPNMGCTLRMTYKNNYAERLENPGGAAVLKFPFRHVAYVFQEYTALRSEPFDYSENRLL